MGEPFRAAERPRDRIYEAFVIAQHLHIADPLGLPVAEFDGLLRLVARGELVRAQASDDPCRSYVEQMSQRGDA